MNSHQTQEDTDMQESLASYFHRSATIVKQYADLFENYYARPVLNYVSWKFKENPVGMTFLSIFATLSALPVVSFIGLSVFALSSIAFLAIISAAVAFIVIEGVLVACLIFMLWSLFLGAVFLTAFVVSIYLTTRLGVLVSSDGPSGVTEWAYETRRHFSRAKIREENEGSDGSTVLVHHDHRVDHDHEDHEAPSSKKIKVEEETPENI